MKIIAYSISALFVTVLFVIWNIYPNMTKESGFPVLTTIFLIGVIICGYMPLLATIFFDKFNKIKK